MKTLSLLTKFIPFIFLFALVPACKKEIMGDQTPSAIDDDMEMQQDPEHWSIVPGKYIVVLDKNAMEKKVDFDRTVSHEQRNKIVLEEVKSLLLSQRIPDKVPEFVYSKTFVGISVTLEKSEAEILNKSKRVAYVEPDRYITLGKPAKPGNDDSPPVQQIPWGIQRVGYADGTGNTAWVIDSGIDLDHPDLNVDEGRSKSFLTNQSSPNDENGHGTHVAGTIGAKDNEIGVIGVAANATLIAVRVLDRRGVGFLSGVLAGIDYVATNGQAGDVANMSLGGGASQSLDNAVLSASNEGILFSIAAGNSSSNANFYSPARVNGSNIYTISAMDSKDIWASFSNYGNPPIDFCAPGVSIYSTWKGGKYNTISGTSMATPHVSGILLLNGNAIATNGYVINDPDGNPDPIAHK